MSLQKGAAWLSDIYLCCLRMCIMISNIPAIVIRPYGQRAEALCLKPKGKAHVHLALLTACTIHPPAHRKDWGKEER